MTPNLYTELFFLDEATAFAAGHRPCFECRRQDYNRFKELWLKGNPEYNFTSTTSIKEIDFVIHNERINKDGSKKMYVAGIPSLPDGVFISINNKAYLIANDHLHLWTADGYTTDETLPGKANVHVLTPESIINTFKAGYIPQMNI